LPEQKVHASYVACLVALATVREPALSPLLKGCFSRPASIVVEVIPCSVSWVIKVAKEQGTGVLCDDVCCAAEGGVSACHRFFWGPPLKVELLLLLA
jgi:hypothetical protein